MSRLLSHCPSLNRGVSHDHTRPDGGQSPSTTSPRPSLTDNTLLRATSDAEKNASPSEPTGNTELDCQVLRQRAFEAVVWGMPAVNTQLMYDQMLKAGGKVGQIIYWGQAPRLA